LAARAGENPAFQLGVNYWPRRKAMYWWKSFDRGEVDEEFAQIAEWGLDHVRFFLLWEDFQPDPQTVSVRQLNNLIAVLDSAERHHLQAVPTLLVGNMSGIIWLPRWLYTDRPANRQTFQWTAGRYVDRQVGDFFGDAGLLEAQALLAREAANAARGHPALHSWDLANEIDQVRIPTPHTARLWLQSLRDAIRSGDPAAPVTYGAHALSLTTTGLTVPLTSEFVDYLCMHAYPMYNQEARDPMDTEWVPFLVTLTSALAGRPVLMQEFGLPTALPGRDSHAIDDNFMGESRPQLLVSEDEGAGYYATVLDRLWQVGTLGAVAWCYADYTRDLWDKPPFDLTVRERTFGLVGPDGSPKPAAEVMRRFAREVASGSIVQRLGELGAGRVPLNVDAPSYYSDPQGSLRQAYTRYLEAV
jgi:endo-1,4-beta-mannosidase